MTDYAAAPAQPIVQGLLRAFGNEGVVLTFFGIGIVQTGPNAPFYVGPGNYILTLDPGLPGDVAIDPPFGRFMMTVRSAPGIPTTIVSKGINYGTSPVPGVFVPGPVPGIGANKLQILLANSAGVGTDAATGLEIILWRGDAGVELTNLNIIGPLFAPQGSAVP
jgi:hypothetical protein